MKKSTVNPFAQPKPVDRTPIRLGLTLLIAVMVHLLVIFNLDWNVRQVPQASTSLDVTLITLDAEAILSSAVDKESESKVEPKSSDTQTDKNSLETATTPTADIEKPIEPSEPVEPASSEISPAATAPAKISVEKPTASVETSLPATRGQPPPVEKPKPQAQPVAQSKAKTQPTPPVKPRKKPEPKPTPPPKPVPKSKPQPKPPPAKAVSQPPSPTQPTRKAPIMGREQLSASLAGIQADSAFARPSAKQGPRISQQHTSTNKRDISAWYREAWRKKVERIGNLNYPDEARRQGIYGSLRIRVLINRDGSLNQMRVLKSSGHPTLDQAALNIVRLSAPFAPFTGELAAQYEQVEIIRTWRFEHGDRLSSQ